MQNFPFTAVVGMDDMALALALTAVSPAVGGVLVRGEKGTAKSTIVRALATLLPPVTVVAGCRFSCDPAEPDPSCPDGPHEVSPADDGVQVRPARLVELPVGATEDRVIGSLHLERALTAGVTEYEPGLLAGAHRGLLYVDEVNLLHDHLVDLLLDAAAMGRSTVEREGVSIAHAARFVLVGTMNPEEGELRPQLLDRFGLTVEVVAPRDPVLRADVVRRRLAFDADPGAFASRYAGAEAALAERIAAARSALPSVVLPESALEKIAEVCAAFEVDGMRADIVTARAAVAHAAWMGRSTVTIADIRAAARLALPHRRRRNPFDAPGMDEDLLDRILGPDDPEPTDPDSTDLDPTDPDRTDPSDPSGENRDPAAGESTPSSPADPPTPEGEPSEADPGTQDQESPAAPPSDADQQGNGVAPTSTVGTTRTYRTRRFSVPGTGTGEAGKRSRAITSTGRTIGAARPVGAAHGAVHLPATLRAAAPMQVARNHQGPGIAVRYDDLRLAVREGRESNLVLFCVDASGSMAARRRMEQVKTAVLSLLLDAYQRRDKVGLITFRGAGATLALPATSSVDIAAARLEVLPAGGRTPLAEGLVMTAEVVRQERIRDPRRRPLVVLVTDGRATAGPDAVRRSRQAAAHLASTGTACIVVDCETGRFRLGLARQLAAVMGGEYLSVGEIGADTLTAAARHGRGQAA